MKTNALIIVKAIAALLGISVICGCSQNPVHLDHIIPERLALPENEAEFKKLKEDYELGDNFDVNAHYNLLPCKGRYNGVKTGQVFSTLRTKGGPFGPPFVL